MERGAVKFWLLCMLVLGLLAGSLFAQNRGGGFSSFQAETMPVRTAWLYFIGINDYQYVQKLDTPIADATAVRDLLLEKFQFDNSHLMERYNAEATREHILNDFYLLAGKMTKEDSLFVYYAGHGIEDKILNQGYWIPADGKVGNIASLISNADIRTALAGIQARHIWLVSDSCFSGTLLAERAIPDVIDDRYYREKYKLPSRTILTSGGKEPVADLSGGRDCKKHSVFACYFLKYLKHVQQPYLTPNELFAAVGPNVANNSAQTPVLGTLRQAGDEGGEFILILKSRFSSTAQLPSQVQLEKDATTKLVPVQLPVGKRSSTNWKMLDDYSAVITFDQGNAPAREKQEKWLGFAKKWNQETTYADQARDRASQWGVLAATIARVDEDWAEAKKRVDRESIPIQTRYNAVAEILNFAPADWRYRDEAQTMLERLKSEMNRASNKAAITEFLSPTKSPPNGRDGIEWIYSEPAKLHFSRSEITLGQYKACVEDGVCSKPQNSFSNKKCNWDSNREESNPVNCVNWNQAADFCQWVSGRLPTEEEWYLEASNKGSRKYPWGNRGITCEYAIWGDKENKDGCGGDSTWPVCSMAKGKSASGLCDMSGNVWEWTSSLWKTGGSERVLRGGSWLQDLPDSLQTTSRIKQEASYSHYGIGFRCVLSKH